MTMEFLDGGAIKSLKGHLKKYFDQTSIMIKDRKYYDDEDNENLRSNVEKEVTSLIDIADQNRQKEDLLHSGLNGTDDDKKAKD